MSKFENIVLNMNNQNDRKLTQSYEHIYNVMQFN